MRRVGIVSLYYKNWNYGGMLQSYAMCKAIQKLCMVSQQISINRSILLMPEQSVKKRLQAWLFRYAWTEELLDRIRYSRRLIPDRRTKKFRQFALMIPHSKYIGAPELLPKTYQKYEAFIVGSDQVWNPRYFGDELLRKIFGLQFASPSKRKLSYAASMGAEQAAVGKEDIFRDILADLDFISVREKSAQQFLQPLTDKPVTVVLDPTLLLTQQEWDELAIGPGEKHPHLFAYFLHEKDNRHDEQLHGITDSMSLPLRCIADELNRYPRPETADKQILDAGPKEFLGEIRDAEMVFTNSFHGLVFSVLFHKPFWAFKRNRDGDIGSMNNRIIDFLADFGLSDRLLEDGEVPSLEKLRTPIDYDAVDRILEEKRAFSLNWLKTALNGI